MDGRLFRGNLGEIGGTKEMKLTEHERNLKHYHEHHPSERQATWPKIIFWALIVLVIAIVVKIGEGQ
jgi:hypothetical protein